MFIFKLVGIVKCFALYAVFKYMFAHVSNFPLKFKEERNGSRHLHSTACFICPIRKYFLFVPLVFRDISKANGNVSHISWTIC